MVINLVATPGLGSIWAGRVIAGILQLSFALVGCGLVMFWLWKYFYALALQPLTGEGSATPTDAHGWIGKWGILCLAVSWLWSAISSIGIVRQANREDPVRIPSPADIPPRISDVAPNKSERAG